MPVYIHISDSESADCQRDERNPRGHSDAGLPLDRPRTARRVNADTVSRDGTARLEARCVLARLANALPYSCGRRSGLAMAVCVENLKEMTISYRTHIHHPALYWKGFGKRFRAVPYPPRCHSGHAVEEEHRPRTLLRRTE